MVANDGMQSHCEMLASKTREFSFADVFLIFNWLHAYFVLGVTPSFLGMKPAIEFRKNSNFPISYRYDMWPESQRGKHRNRVT